jgi:hypothetical protein
MKQDLINQHHKQTPLMLPAKYPKKEQENTKQ